MVEIWNKPSWTRKHPSRKCTDCRNSLHAQVEGVGYTPRIPYLRYPTTWVPYPLDTLPPGYPTHWIPYPIPQKGHGTRDTPQKGPGTSDTLLPVDRMTHSCENMTFPQLLWRSVNISWVQKQLYLITFPGSIAYILHLSKHQRINAQKIHAGRSYGATHT